MKGFNFSYTCPLINDNIEDFRETILKNIETIIRDCSPLIENAYKLAKQYESDIYTDVEKYFENVRSCNQDMRSEAEKQIDEIKSDLDDKDYELNDANDTIYKLEKEIDNLKSDLDDKEYELNEANNKINELESELNNLKYNY